MLKMDTDDVVWLPDEMNTTSLIEEDVEVVTVDVIESDAGVLPSLGIDVSKSGSVNQADAINLNHSHAIAYNKLVPIGGIQNLSALAEFNSTTSRVLFMEGTPERPNIQPVDTNLKLNGVFHDFDANERQSDCIIVKSECVDDLPEQSSASTSYEEQTEFNHFNQDPHSKSQIDIKPLILSDGTAVSFTRSDDVLADVPIKMERFDEHIKSEYPDETSGSVVGEVMIKTEAMDFEAFDHEIADVCDSGAESTEHFLNSNPAIFTKFCGLSNFTLFNALLEYITDDMETMKGVTKYEQLFSVLTKLHRNEENLYLNKYIFPSAYVSIVELLYKKLHVLYKDLPDSDSIPAILTPEFDDSQKVVIFGVLTLNIKEECFVFPKALKSVQYLIGYTAFGEVFFVSRAFIGATDILKLIVQCGVLNKLDGDHWILLRSGDIVQVAQVDKFLLKKAYTEKFSEIHSPTVQQHTFLVINKLVENFKIFEGSFPDYMIASKKDASFLDKLVFVCCMLLNMLPRCTYK